MAIGKKATGLILLGVGAAIIIITTVIAGVLNHGVKDGIKNIWVYEHDSKYDDPNYEDCSNTTRSYYLYNITNVDDFLYNGKKMALELKGPYNFTVETCKFNFTVEDDTQYYKQYLKEPIFVETPGLSDEDILYTLNPGYNALLKVLRQAAPGVEPEFLLSAQVSVGILAEVLAGMQTSSTIQQIRLGASPVMLTQAKQQFINAVKTPSEHIVMANYIAAQYAAGYSSPFFNDHTFPGGVSNIATFDLGFSNASIALILNGNGPSHPGILSDLNTGAGVVYLLALNDSAAIAASSLQLEVLQSYLAAFPGMALTTQVAQTQSTLFYTQWVSSAVTTPTDINMDGIPDLELAANNTGISVSTATKLWNATSSTSIQSSMGFATWYQAAYDPTVLATLQSLYNLTSTQSSIIANWAVNWANNIAPVLLNENYGIDNNTDLAYAQWGLGTVFGGLSLHDLQPESLSAPPEFAFFTNFALTFDAVKSKALLTDPVNGLLQFENMFTLLSAYQSAPVVQAKWNITVTEATALAGYFSYFITTFSDTYISSFFANYTAGPVIAVTPFEFIWSNEDPLLKALGGFPYTGFAQEYPFYTRENPEPKNNTIFRGGNEEELSNFLHVHKHEDTGNSTLYIYREPYQVGGWNGAGFTPNFEDESADIWFDLYLRIITLVKGGEYDLDGITTNEYTVSDSLFENSMEFPDNDLFYSGIHGTVNLTGYYKAELYSGYPDYEGNIPMWKNATISTPKAKWGGISIFVEPTTGVTLKVTAGLCAYYMYHPSDRYYSGLNSTGLVPIWGQYSNTEATEDDLSSLHTLFKAKKAALVLNIVGPIVGGVFITAGFVVLAYLFRKGVIDRTDFELEVDTM